MTSEPQRYPDVTFIDRSKEARGRLGVVSLILGYELFWLLIKDLSVTVKCRTAIKVQSLYFNLCLSVMLYSLSCSFISILSYCLFQYFVSYCISYLYPFLLTVYFSTFVLCISYFILWSCGDCTYFMRRCYTRYIGKHINFIILYYPSLNLKMKKY